MSELEDQIERAREAINDLTYRERLYEGHADAIEYVCDTLADAVATGSANTGDTVSEAIAQAFDCGTGEAPNPPTATATREEND